MRSSGSVGLFVSKIAKVEAEIMREGENKKRTQRSNADKNDTALKTAAARQTLKVWTKLHKTNFTCLAREKTRKWHLKLTLVRVQTWSSLTALGEGMKIS